MKQVEKLHGQKESRRMYQPVNDIRKEFKPYTTACRDSTGMILNFFFFFFFLNSEMLQFYASFQYGMP